MDFRPQVPEVVPEMTHVGEGEGGVVVSVIEAVREGRPAGDMKVFRVQEEFLRR